MTIYIVCLDDYESYNVLCAFFTEEEAKKFINKEMNKTDRINCSIHRTIL
jgi:hypothetical protein